MTQRPNARLEAGLLRVRRTAKRLQRMVNRGPEQRTLRAFSDLRQRFYRDLWERTAHSIGADINDVGFGFSSVRRRGKETFVDSSGAFVDSRLGAKMALNKVLIHQIFDDDPAYVAPEYCRYSLASIHDAHDFMARMKGAVVVKPAQDGYAGRGVTAGVNGPTALREASLAAATFSSQLMGERHVAGTSYRLLFLHGTLIQVLRRGPPTVVGNGRDTIRALMAAETRRRISEETIRSLHPLQPDLDCRLCLRVRDLTLNSVPGTDESVAVKTVVNQSGAQDNDIVSVPVHTGILALGARVSALLQLPLVSLDIIAPTLETSLTDSGGVINEVNAQPGLHHHYLVRAPSAGVDVASLVLEAAFDSVRD